ncbi:MAG: ribose 5-phosphate isomerase B [Sphingobacteriales bacterium]|nr:ribose 5-phosphate isomerase B [Sphingobacteriales bacterium]
MKIAIGGDHAGFEYKQMLMPMLEAAGHEVKDFGPFNADSVDYPDFVHPLATAVQAKEFELGILICGSANGVAITANKHENIRAAICWDVPLAALARQHNDANVVCIPARFTTPEQAQEITTTFINTTFEGGRHATRVNKINC